jgi:hypothetical protein
MSKLKTTLHILTATVVLGMTGTTAAAQQQLPAASAFVAAPDSIFPVLSTNTRLDMLDYFHSNIARPSTNTFNGQSQIISEEPMLLTIDMTPSVDVQVAVIPQKGDSIYALIQTVAMPVKDSEIRFFNKDWTPLKVAPLTVSIDHWLNTTNKETREDILNELPFILATAEFNPTDYSITLTNNMGEYYAKSDRPKWFGNLREKLVYSYDGKCYVLTPQ